MPFSLIETVLGVCFALVWVFIGAMVLRDGQSAIRRERESDAMGTSAARRVTSPPRSHGQFRMPGRRARSGRRTSAA